MQAIREYQSVKGQLPFSFDNAKIRSAYVKIKAANKESPETKFTEKSLEYFLYMFKSA